MKTPYNCKSLSNLKEYLSEEKPYIDYCLIEIDDENYSSQNAWDEIEIPISQGMRSFLVDWCYSHGRFWEIQKVLSR